MKALPFLISPLFLAAALCGCGGRQPDAAPAAADSVPPAAPDSVTPDSAAADSATRELTLALTGDIMLGTLFPTPTLAPDSGRHVFDDVRELLVSADIAAGNLEGVLADTGTSRKNPESEFAYAFLMPTYLGRELRRADYDFVGIANNHIYDFYADGIVRTERALKALGIGFAGARVPGSSRPPVETYVCERGGVRFGFCAFCHERYTQRMQDEASVRRILRNLRAQCDILVVCFHGGAEGKTESHLPEGTEYFQGDDRGNLRHFAHLCVDNGADVVYGHGPHVLRAMECYKGRLIAYSLGNFCTVAGISLSGISGYAPLLRIRVSERGEFLGGRIHSFLQQRLRGPRRDPAHHAAREIRDLTRQDIPAAGLVISADGEITPQR